MGRAGVLTPRPPLHHVPASSQQNFGTVFTMWDRLSGRLLVRDAAPEERTGVPGEVDLYPQQFVTAFRQPLREASGRRCSAGWHRDRRPGRAGPRVADVAEFERAGLYHRDAPGAVERLNLLRVVGAGRIAGGHGGRSRRRRAGAARRGTVLPPIDRSADPGRASGVGRHRRRGTGADAPRHGGSPFGPAPSAASPRPTPSSSGCSGRRSSCSVTRPLSSCSG